MIGEFVLRSTAIICMLVFVQNKEYSFCPDETKLDGCECDNTTSTIICINKLMPKIIKDEDWRNITLINYPETEIRWDHISTDIVVVKDSKINGMYCTYCSSFIDATFINIVGNPRISSYLYNENYRLVNVTLIDCAFDYVGESIVVPSMEHIVVKYNDLEKIEVSFLKLKILAELDLSHNVIEYLGKNSLAFKTITNLTVNLSNNKIDSYMVKQAQIANLGKGTIHLNLSNNLITNLTKDVYEIFARNESNVFIDLANNSIKCSWEENKWVFEYKEFAEHHLANIFCQNFNKYLFDMTEDEFITNAPSTLSTRTPSTKPTTEYYTSPPITTIEPSTTTEIYSTTSQDVLSTIASKTVLIYQAQLLEKNVTDKINFLESINKTSFIAKLNDLKTKLHELSNELAHISGNIVLNVIEEQLWETETAIKLCFNAIDMCLNLISGAHSLQTRISEALEYLVNTPSGKVLKEELLVLNNVTIRLDNETDWNNIRHFEIELAMIEDKVNALIGPGI